MGNCKPIGVSIVVPTYNSSLYLSRLLKSIDLADKEFGVVEVLVIDDSSPEEAKRIQTLCRESGVIFLECRGNVSLKRNFGSDRASFDTILFIDSDCEVTQKLIARHASLVNLPREVGAILGLVEFTGTDTFVWQAVERSQFLGAYAFARRMHNAPWGVTCNLSVRRKVLQEVGGFDTSFLRSPGGEDVDMGLRINKAGYRIQCDPEGVIHHTRDTWQSWRRMIRRVWGYGRAHYHLMVKHPDKVGYDYPRLAVIFLMVMLLASWRAAFVRSGFPLLVLLAFGFIVMLLQAVLCLWHAKLKLISLPQELAAHLFDLVFEFGLVVESLRHLSLRGCYGIMIYAQQQLISERERKFVQMWSLTIGFVLWMILK